MYTPSLFIIQWDFHILRKQNRRLQTNGAIAVGVCIEKQRYGNTRHTYFGCVHRHITVNCKHIYLTVCVCVREYRQQKMKYYCVCLGNQGAFNLHFMQIVSILLLRFVFVWLFYFSSLSHSLSFFSLVRSPTPAAQCSCWPPKMFRQ